jgi:tRNA(Ile)-lysidine synthase
MCRRNGIDLLLAAHHQDDQTETLMLQLMRGAGLPGLSGMALVQEDHALLGKGLVLGRPLLEISRAAIEKYASLHDVSFVVDESNLDVSYRRNALRQSVFPLLQQHFPGFSACVTRSASHIRTAQVLLEELAESDLNRCRIAGNELALNLNGLAGLSPQRCNNVLRYWLHGLGVPLPATARLEDLRQQVVEARQDKQPLVELGDFALSRTGRSLVLRPNLGSPPTEEMFIQWHGEAQIPVPQWRGALAFERVEAGGMAEHRLLTAPLVIRARSGQERFKPAINRPSKTLKNLFQEAAIPAWQREWLPLGYLDRQLVFVAGLGMDVRHRTTGAGIVLSWRSDWQNTR